MRATCGVTRESCGATRVTRLVAVIVREISRQSVEQPERALERRESCRASRVKPLVPHGRRDRAQTDVAARAIHKHYRRRSSGGNKTAISNVRVVSGMASHIDSSYEDHTNNDG